jgi:lipoate synthase
LQIGWIIRWIKQRLRTLAVDGTGVEVVQAQTLHSICNQGRHGNAKQCLNEFKGAHESIKNT